MVMFLNFLGGRQTDTEDLFQAVKEGNVKLLKCLLQHRNVDVS